jgi:hypothetical protein
MCYMNPAVQRHVISVMWILVQKLCTGTEATNTKCNLTAKTCYKDTEFDELKIIFLFSKRCCWNTEEEITFHII